MIGTYASDPRHFRIRTVVGGTLFAWRRDLLYVTLLAGLVQLPVVLIDVWVFGADGVSFNTDDPAGYWVTALMIMVTGALTHHLLSGVLEEIEGADRRGEPKPTLAHLARKLPWGRLVLADLILAVIVTAGVIALIVPGLILSALFCLVMPLLNLERQGLGPTFRRSAQLTRPFLGTVVIVWVSAQFLVDGLTEWLDHLIHLLGHTFLLDVTAHLFPEMVLLPLGALPAVVMMYQLLDREAALAADESGTAVLPTEPLADDGQVDRSGGVEGHGGEGQVREG